MATLASPDLALRLPPGEGPYQVVVDTRDGEAVVQDASGRVRLRVGAGGGEELKMWPAQAAGLAERTCHALLAELGLSVAA